MEKNRIRPMKSGRSSRMTYSRQKEVLQMPNLIEVQKDSYQWFLDEGLKEVFDDISPIDPVAAVLAASHNEISCHSLRAVRCLSNDNPTSRVSIAFQFLLD